MGNTKSSTTKANDDVGLNGHMCLWPGACSTLRTNAKMSKAMTEALLEEGEKHMNLMGQRLAQEQVEFIDQQAKQLEERLFKARDAILEYQNENGLVAPTQTVEAIFTTVSRLQAELALHQRPELRENHL